MIIISQVSEGNQEDDLVKKDEIEISFVSRLQYIDLVEGISDSITQMAGFDEDTCYWIGLSLRESVTNAIQHGNKLDEGKRVGVRFEIEPDRLVILVQDQGEGFDESKLPDPRAPENLLKPSGRGVFYVRSFMDDVSFRCLPEGGLEVRMEKRLNRNRGEEHAN